MLRGQGWRSRTRVIWASLDFDKDYQDSLHDPNIILASLSLLFCVFFFLKDHMFDWYFIFFFQLINFTLQYCIGFALYDLNPP